jgi:dnd system-associated protein 4|tara:strand:+ start:96 stop:554 length:459 start_codon:yes stop_codon:yes gene_type:complete
MRRVKRPKDRDELFVSLCSKENELNLERFSDVFTLAASIGFKHNKFVPFDKSAETIRWETFREHSQVALRMMAFAHTNDPEVILQGNEGGENKMLEVVEGFANGGCDILQKEIIDAGEGGTDRLTAIMELIMSGYEDKESISSDDILKQFIT